MDSVADKNSPHTDHRGLELSKLTPMLQHYVQTKEQYPHALVLYRVGDFFECFFADACTVSQQLELILTSKEGGKEVGRVAMTGVPHHALERYAAQLVEKGYAIVVCDQIEDAAIAAKEGRQVRREITKILTPGTLTEATMLRAKQNNFLAALVIANQHWGLAYADISTGEFCTSQASHLEQLNQELARLQPAEILVPTNAPDPGGMLRPGEKSSYLPTGLLQNFCYTCRPQQPFSISEARNLLLQTFQVRSLEGMGCEHLPLAVRAAGGLLEYLNDTQKGNPVPLQLLRTYTLTDYLIVDQQSRRNLEITQTVRDSSFHGSLLWAIDRTNTAMGGRALRQWLLAPVLDPAVIRSRQDTIQELMEQHNLRREAIAILKDIYDMERLAGRAGAGTANARELVALADSLLKLPDLAHLVQNAKAPYLQALQLVPPELEALGQLIRRTLVEAPPLHLQEGGLIRTGVDTQVDELRQLSADDQQWLITQEALERKRTGISTLKIGYNKAFGYYISIPRSKADQAPPDYIRKQTLTNEERFITPDLKERENKILSAKEQLQALEYELFTQLRAEAGRAAAAIRRQAQAVAALDVLCSLAEVALHLNYCRPEIIDNLDQAEIQIIDGRHPVVEQSLPAGFFVPNSAHLGGSSPDLVILTGPNASGKSCYLRQVGLIQLLAQTGSFVPATKARLGICDRIFTRVGAVDDLATGQSTFMVEMNETANILNHATPRSLVLLDEIGRGTATFDGLAIAWAVAEYLAQTIQAKTIFATHYHELNELASFLPNVANYQVTVKELPDQIVFLHQVQPGGADRSYGIEAGRLAGLPPVVISRAKEVMGQIEKHSKIATGLRKGNQKKTTPSPQLDMFG